MLPTRAASIPWNSDSRVTSSSFCNSGVIIAYRNRNRRIAVVAVQHHTAIDGNNISRFQHPPLRRDAVHDLVVHRGAQHAGIIVISLERRLGAQVPDLALGHPLQIHGGTAGRHRFFAASSTWRTMRPLRRIFSISAGDLQTIDILDRAKRLRHYRFHRLIAVHFDQPPAAR